MKKMISIMLSAICMITISACGSASGAERPSDSGGSTSGMNALSSSTAGGKTLIAYFSATGTTQPLAEYASEALGADLYEIVPVQPYTQADLAYYTDGRADREQGDPSARPAISGSALEMSQYNVIILGYPIWHGQAPKIISTFLESYDFSGKTIVPFCTSQSSGIGSSDTNLHTLAAAANWLPGRRFAGSTSKNVIEEWIRGLDINENTYGGMK